MADAAAQKNPDLVTVTIDGKPLQVAKGTNLIEAAKGAGIDIPHYCYHRHLSVAGNCRMCQVQVKGQPKMTIACNTNAAEGMEVATHHSSKEVADAQAATLEFILINHPLDCTVCDQAGHCKLQDYHFEYNARSSRFLEEKVHKAKAVPLGPTVMLDGERCIMCSRCVRFCDEVTGTSELGMLNRGDQTVIAVSPGRELSNPLSGSVVDLCPVGALTHRKWRFNTRIWFTKQTDSICPGCSTGCNVKVAERDGEIVQVKARLNSDVNKEWLCDEGRYGYDRFRPKHRVTAPYKNVRGTGSVEHVPAALSDVLSALKGSLKTLTILLSPDLLLEEFYMLKSLLLRSSAIGRVVVAYRERTLSKVEAILVSPDYAANFRGAQFTGLVGDTPESDYNDVIAKIRRKEMENILILGDRAVMPQDIDSAFLDGLIAARCSVGVLNDSESALATTLQYVVPGRSIVEKGGLLLNRAHRLQYAQAVVDFPEGSLPEWRFIGLLGEAAGVRLLPGSALTMSDRDVTRWYLATDPQTSSLGLSIAKITSSCGVPLGAAGREGVNGASGKAGETPSTEGNKSGAASAP
jgi:NADH-quinone oxidoreductase subunit G